MKYIFIDTSDIERTIEVPQEYIDRTRRSLNCSVAEACDLYVYDEGYAENEAANELNAKAGTQKKRKGPKRKEDPIKRALINYLQDTLAHDVKIAVDSLDHYPTNVTITNPERIVQFKIDDDIYELTLSRKRKTKA